LILALMRAAGDILQRRPLAEPALRGVLLVTENQKIMRAAGRRLLTGLGWHGTGSHKRGLDIWRIEFE
jgi:hypothetical protein